MPIKVEEPHVKKKLNSRVSKNHLTRHCEELSLTCGDEAISLLDTKKRDCFVAEYQTTAPRNDGNRYFCGGIGLKFCLSILVFVFYNSNLCFAAEPPRYEINAKIDTAKHMISASQKVTFTNNSSKEINEIHFHIYPHRKYTDDEKNFILRYAAYFSVNPYPDGFQNGDLEITAVSSGGKKIKYEITGSDKTILKVKLPEPVAAGKEAVVDLDFEVEIPHSYGRFGWHKNITSLLRWYPILSVLDHDEWHSYPSYPYHQPYFSDASLYSVYLTLPVNEVVIHSGVSKDETNNPDGTKTIHIESELPLRDFGMALSPDYKVKSLDAGGVKINSFYLAGDEFYGQKALDFAKDLFEYNTKNFTAYPYKEFSIAPSFLGYGGTQSSNLILIDTRVYRLPKLLMHYFDFLIAHEASHQWFYNIVGSDEFSEMFIDEGFNSYSLLRYLESKYGPDAKVMILPKGVDWFVPNFSFTRAQVERYSFVAKNSLDRPVLGELSSFQEPSSIFSITYGKGSKIVDMLRYVMGDAAFEKMMKRYFKEYQFKNISVNDLRRLSSEEAKQDLSWFFDEWLNTTKKCDYAVKDVKANKIFLVNNGDIVMPVKVRVGLDGGKEQDFDWDGKGREKEFRVDKEDTVKYVRVDPDKRILDMEMVNNNWHRKVDFVPVPLYYPAYELPVFLKSDAYSLVAGPIVGSDLGLKASWQKPQDNIFYAAGAFNINEKRYKNTVGFQQKHLFNQQISAGAEGYYNIGTHGRTDQEGFKLYIRKELWPFAYGLFDENDHVTMYFFKNDDFKSTMYTGISEDIRNLYYSKQREAIIGANFKIGRYGPYPDPITGWNITSTLENAEHFLGGKVYYWRFTPEFTGYFNLKPQNIFAGRVKLGWSSSSDKSLFQLGGERGLRGYGYKTINGAQCMMLNLEYRRDIIDGLDIGLLDNIVTLNKIQGVGFFDVGKSWFSDFNDRGFKKDVGLGVRLHVSLASFLQKVIVRLDAAQPLHEPKGKRYYWFGLEQAF